MAKRDRNLRTRPNEAASSPHSEHKAWRQPHLEHPGDGGCIVIIGVLGVSPGHVINHNLLQVALSVLLDNERRASADVVHTDELDNIPAVDNECTVKNSCMQRISDGSV